MINIRYHIVSITAVFLALAIGTALGSTFLDGPTVDLLNRNIRSAEDRIEATNAENARLSEINDASREREEALLADGSPLFSTMLTDRPVLILVAPGVDPGEATGLVEVLAGSGADFRGVVDLKDDLLLGDGFDEDLAVDLGIEETEEVNALRDAVTERLADALTAAAQEPPPIPDGDRDGEEEGEADADGGSGAEPETGPGPSTPADTPEGDQGSDDGTSGPGATPEEGLDGAGAGDGSEPEPGDAVLDGTQPEIITILEERGYVSVEHHDDDDDPILEVPGYRYVLLTGHEPSAPQQQVGLALLGTDAGGAPLPMVVVTTSPPERDEGGSEPSSLLRSIRDDDDLKGRYSTVDNVDHFSGVTAMILLLHDIGTTNPGHYGQGPGAQAVLPAVP